MSEARALLLQRLLRDAYRQGHFRLASGRESDFFVDCKRVILTAEGHRLAGEALWHELAVSGWDSVTAVAGVALGGCPLASAVALTSAMLGRGLDALYVRKEAKDHGTGARIEGSVPRGSTVVLLEDVLTTGASSRAAIEALQAEDYTVAGVLALVDRAEGGVESLAAAGVPVRSLFTRADFVQ